MDGIVNIFKPAGMTSMNVISRVRRILGEKKVGHIGTLDPDVTGVLPVFIGKATRAIHYVQDGGKSYSAEMLLGVTTDTQDATGIVLSSSVCEAEDAEIVAALKSFKGEYVQNPPMYSAKKVGGQKLCDLARKGIEVERKPHPVEIYSIKNITVTREAQTLEIRMKFDVDCSRGTYIRTLCHDVGIKLGCGAHMSWLQRTASCGFKLEDTVTLEELETAAESGELNNIMQDIESLFEDLPAIIYDSNLRVDLLNGKKLKASHIMHEGLYSILDDEGQFVALARVYFEISSGVLKVKLERQFVI
ncbi:MAG: tRNA pseudouridine(55) synthase TruB [Bacillota bacterium]